MKPKVKSKSKSESASANLSISFAAKSGLTLISVALAKLLELTQGDFIEFGQGDSPSDWFVRKVVGHGSIVDHYQIKVRTSTAGTITYTNHTGLCRDVRSSLDYFDYTALSIPVSKKPSEDGWHALLTSKVKKDEILKEFK